MRESISQDRFYNLQRFIKLYAPCLPFLTKEMLGPALANVHASIDPHKAKRGELSVLSEKALKAVSAELGEQTTDERPLVRARIAFPHHFDDFPTRILWSAPGGVMTEENADKAAKYLAIRWHDQLIPGRRPTDPHQQPGDWVQSLPSNTPSTDIYGLPEHLRRVNSLRARYPGKAEPFGAWFLQTPTDNPDVKVAINAFALTRDRGASCDPHTNQLLAELARQAYLDFAIALHVGRIFLELVIRQQIATSVGTPTEAAAWVERLERWQLNPLNEPTGFTNFAVWEPADGGTYLAALGPRSAAEIVRLHEQASERGWFLTLH